MERDETIVNGLGAELDSYLSGMVADGFSGAVLVAQGGDVVLHKGYGLADKALEVPITTETVFDTGSVCKMFTAAATLKLEEQGSLSVEDPITKYFDGVPEEKAGITIHHLLTHTGGLQMYSGEDEEAISRDEMVRRVLEEELRFPVGTRHGYSNPSFGLLGAIIELVSGQAYESYVHEQVFRPAGMLRTGYVIPQWAPGQVAHGYSEENPGTPMEWWMDDGPGWNLRANGGMLSNAGDIYRWHVAFEGGVVLSEEGRRKMITPYLPAKGVLPRDASSGYGVYVWETPRGTRMITRGGTSQFGYSSYRWYVDEGVVAIMTTNQEHTRMREVEEEIAGRIFGV